MDFNIVGAFVLVTSIIIASVAFVVVALMRRNRNNENK